MSEKLKTLAEITALDIALSGLIPSIREEAMKWIVVIKEKIKIIEVLESGPQSPLQKAATHGLVEILEGQIKIFVDFFNITDEELKGCSFTHVQALPDRTDQKCMKEEKGDKN